MIVVTITDGRIAIDGHAGYAKKGEDIVCAGVSAIFQTAILGLEAIAQEYPQHIYFRDERNIKIPE